LVLLPQKERAKKPVRSGGGRKKKKKIKGGDVFSPTPSLQRGWGEGSFTPKREEKGIESLAFHYVATERGEKKSRGGKIWGGELYTFLALRVNYISIKKKSTL